jgi:hypothetical protein
MNPAQYTRLGFSRAAWDRLVNERVIPPNGAPLVIVNATWSAPKKRVITAAAAAPSTLWVEG